MKNNYIPIACHLHDHIEHFATLKKQVDISYKSVDGENQLISDIIIDWINDGEGEYLRLKNLNQMIRMDRILSIDEVDFTSSNTYC